MQDLTVSEWEKGNIRGILAQARMSHDVCFTGTHDCLHAHVLVHVSDMAALLLVSSVHTLFSGQLQHCPLMLLPNTQTPENVTSVPKSEKPMLNHTTNLHNLVPWRLPV